MKNRIGNKIVIAKTPRNRPFLVFGSFGVIALCAAMILHLDVRDLHAFSSEGSIVKIDSFTIKTLGCVFFITTPISFLLAAIRNNTQSQPVEAAIFFLGLFFAIFLVVFSTPIVFFWAHMHGYHFDHYEAIHRGGWYYFRLNDS